MLVHQRVKWQNFWDNMDNAEQYVEQDQAPQTVRKWENLTASELRLLVNVYMLLWKDPPCYSWEITSYFDWAIFNCYVSSPGRVDKFIFGLFGHPEIGSAIHQSLVLKPIELLIEMGRAAQWECYWVKALSCLSTLSQQYKLIGNPRCCLNFTLCFLLEFTPEFLKLDYRTSSISFSS